MPPFFGAGIQHVFQLIHKGVDIAELAVDGSKAHIGNVVHLFQLLHGKVPNIDGGHFPVVRVQQHLFNAADGGIQLLIADGALFAGAQHAVEQFLAVEHFTRTVFF